MGKEELAIIDDITSVQKTVILCLKIHTKIGSLGQVAAGGA